MAALSTSLSPLELVRGAEYPGPAADDSCADSFVTTSGMSWSPTLQFVNSVLGVDRILFAADYPFESMKEAVQFMDSAPVTDREREKIYHLNTEKLLALSSGVIQGGA